MYNSADVEQAARQAANNMGHRMGAPVTLYKPNRAKGKTGNGLRGAHYSCCHRCGATLWFVSGIAAGDAVTQTCNQKSR